MDLSSDIVRIRSGSPEAEALRLRALTGDPSALKRYVYFAAWQQIRGDRFVRPRDKYTTFKKLVEADLIEVRLG